MSATPKTLHGGPLDGLKVSIGFYGWVDPHGHVTASPRVGAFLYRRSPGFSGLLYRGHSETSCLGCGAFHKLDGAICSLCGGKLFRGQGGAPSKPDRISGDESLDSG